MARVARVVLPGLPHHVLQRGVRSLGICHSDADWQAYVQWLATFTVKTVKTGTVLFFLALSK